MTTRILRCPDPWGVRLILGLRKLRIEVVRGIFADEAVRGAGRG